MDSTRSKQSPRRTPLFLVPLCHVLFLLLSTVFCIVLSPFSNKALTGLFSSIIGPVLVLVIPGVSGGRSALLFFPSIQINQASTNITHSLSCLQFTFHGAQVSEDLIGALMSLLVGACGDSEEAKHS